MQQEKTNKMWDIQVAIKLQEAHHTNKQTLFQGTCGQIPSYKL